MVTIKKATIADAPALLALSKKTFYDFFGHLNDPANMEAYASNAFTLQRIFAELTNSDSVFYFALLNDEVAGYLKLNFGDAQTEFRDKNAVEIERIYVLGEHHGKHIGSLLLNFAFETAKNRQLDHLWLGVWENNHSAIGFYEHNGFEIFSSHEFLLGTDQQTDLLMKKKVV